MGISCKTSIMDEALTVNTDKGAFMNAWIIE